MNKAFDIVNIHKLTVKLIHREFYSNLLFNTYTPGRHTPSKHTRLITYANNITISATYSNILAAKAHNYTAILLQHPCLD